MAAQINRILDQMVSRRCDFEDWRNPEIYPPLMVLLDPARNVDQYESSLQRLEVEIGLGRAEERFAHADGLYRTGFPDFRIIEVKGGVCNRVDGRIVFEVAGFTPRFLLPFDGLFCDLLDINLYPAVEEGSDASLLQHLCLRGANVLRSYDAALAGDLENAIDRVVLTADFGHPDRWSYNLRLGYFRSLFLNPYRLNPSSFAESLIHEYYHQRMWLWWAHRPPKGMPPEDPMVVSPLTGRKRPLSVMVQALMIYVGLVDFYRERVAAQGWKENSTASWDAQRLADLIVAIPVLHRRLAQEVAPRSEIRALLDFLLAEMGEKS